jgi:hypothetical protein
MRRLTGSNCIRSRPIPKWQLAANGPFIITIVLIWTEGKKATSADLVLPTSTRKEATAGRVRQQIRLKCAIMLLGLLILLTRGISQL